MAAISSGVALCYSTSVCACYRRGFCIALQSCPIELAAALFQSLRSPRIASRLDHDGTSNSSRVHADYVSSRAELC